MGDVGMGVLLCMGRRWDGSVTVYESMLGWECYCVRVDVGMGVLLCMGRCWDGSAIVYVHVRVEFFFFVDVTVQD